MQGQDGHNEEGTDSSCKPEMTAATLGRWTEQRPAAGGRSAPCRSPRSPTPPTLPVVPADPQHRKTWGPETRKRESCISARLPAHLWLLLGRTSSKLLPVKAHTHVCTRVNTHGWELTLAAQDRSLRLGGTHALLIALYGVFSTPSLAVNTSAGSELSPRCDLAIPTAMGGQVSGSSMTLKGGDSAAAPAGPAELPERQPGMHTQARCSAQQAVLGADCEPALASQLCPSSQLEWVPYTPVDGLKPARVATAAGLRQAPCTEAGAKSRMKHLVKALVPQGKCTWTQAEYDLVSAFEVDHRGDYVSHEIMHHQRRRREVAQQGGDALHLRVKGDRHDFHMDLMASSGLVAPGFVVQTLGRGGTKSVHSFPPEDFCFYQGSLRAHRNASVALSTCQGLSGVIRTEEADYFLKPLPPHLAGKLNSSAPGGAPSHLLYKRSTETWAPRAVEVLLVSRRRELPSQPRGSSSDLQLPQKQHFCGRRKKSPCGNGGPGLAGALIMSLGMVLGHHMGCAVHCVSLNGETSTTQSRCPCTQPQGCGHPDLCCIRLVLGTFPAFGNGDQGLRTTQARLVKMCMEGKRFRSTLDTEAATTVQLQTPMKEDSRAAAESGEEDGMDMPQRPQDLFVLPDEYKPCLRPKRSLLESHRNEELNVETLVVVDRTMMRSHGQENITTYVLTILNMVSVLFKDGTIGGNINIAIVGLILLEDEQPGLVISHHADRTLSSFCQWQSGLIGKDGTRHDHAILLTGLDICSWKNEPCDTLGFAPISGMCSKYRSCTVNEDTGLGLAFTIAHESGHNFGMVHDGEGNMCKKSEGNIMSPTLAGRNGVFSWSPCSRQYLHKFLSTAQATCLADQPKPVKEYKYPEKLPGELYDANTQCKWQFGEKAKLCMLDFKKASDYWQRFSAI
ncbi:A disintegrin and metalloproteinase with thrombospondin motifs 16 [Fukomys damarensis]|uniref:A disintegrin and metalloproteinase with thrombospondin motifs 16 n=1 Tax=Fukomys damarensis TaxID=885580 RepID=A0A091E262_FUKDA|nr:A disintegrin and metalloproteinase with thrombospondin motifs 16 [Fukomys damarensis]